MVVVKTIPPPSRHSQKDGWYTKVVAISLSLNSKRKIAAAGQCCADYMESHTNQTQESLAANMGVDFC